MCQQGRWRKGTCRICRCHHHESIMNVGHMHLALSPIQAHRSLYQTRLKQPSGASSACHSCCVEDSPRGSGIWIHSCSIAAIVSGATRTHSRSTILSRLFLRSQSTHSRTTNHRRISTSVNAASTYSSCDTSRSETTSSDVFCTSHMPIGFRILL